MKINQNITDEEFQKKNSDLHHKLDNGEKLTKEEEFFICNCLRPEYLLQYPFCLDEFYKRSFLAINLGLPAELYPLNEREHIYYSNLVKEWQTIIYKTNHKDQMVYMTAVETREEPALFKGYSFVALMFFTGFAVWNQFHL